MAERDVTDHVLGVWAAILDRAGARNPRVVALELKAVLDGQGIRLAVPAHRHDPAADWREQPEPVPADAVDEYRAAREALREAQGD